MYRVSKQGNYIIVVDTSTGEEMEGIASDMLIHRDYANSTSWHFKGLNGNIPMVVPESQLLDGAAVDLKGVQFVREAPVLTTNILNGSATTATTIITIPANKIWRGSVQVAASLFRGAGDASISGNSRIVLTSGSGGTSSYTIAQVMLSCAYAGGLSAVGTQANDAVCIPDVEIYAGTTNATVTLANTNNTQFFGSATGKIVN